MDRTVPVGVPSFVPLTWGWPKTALARRETARHLIGARVHSFDFHGRELEGERACYVTGTVVGILEAGELADDGETRFNDCDRYIIAVSRRTFAGRHTGPFGGTAPSGGERVFPPLNGTPSTMGGVMNGVVHVEASEALEPSAEWFGHDDAYVAHCEATDAADPGPPTGRPWRSRFDGLIRFIREGA